MTEMGLPFNVAPPFLFAAYVLVHQAPGPPANSMTTAATGVEWRRAATQTEKEG